MRPRLRDKKERISPLAVDSWDSPARGLADSLRGFGAELLQRECTRYPQQNVFISPLSVFLALAMARDGAGGATKVAMRTALGLPSYPSDAAIHDAVSALCKSLRSQNGINLAIANSLWADIRTTLVPEFEDVCQRIYDASARTLDFRELSAANTINQWVSEKTKGEISRIVTPDTVREASVVLINAVYFRGRFADPFPKEKTKPQTFYLANGESKLVPMMQRFGLTGSYRSGKRFDAAALRYEGSPIALFALLPQKGVSPEQLLAEEPVPELFEHDRVKLDLSMPSFTVEFGSELKNSLEQMGMAIAFQYLRADFVPLGSPEFYISQVIHKTKLEIDEEGTIATATTGVGICLGAVALPQPMEKKTLVINRPFAVLLLDTSTGATLFAGTIYDP